MAEPLIREVPKKELNLSFFIRLVEMRSNLGSFERLETTVKDPNGNEIKHDYLNTHNDFNDILEEIKNLHNVLELSRNSGNSKLIEGIREEILSKVAILISKIY